MYNKLNELGAKQVFLCGVYTDVCIAKTAMDLFDGGFEPFVIEDCCASPYGQELHRVAIESLGHIIGKNRIINSSTLKLLSKWIRLKLAKSVD